MFIPGLHLEHKHLEHISECGESHFQCCWKGMEYGMEIAEEKRMMMMYDFDDGVDLKTKCYATALAQAKNRTLPTGCINQYLRFCLEAVQEEGEKRALHRATVKKE